MATVNKVIILGNLGKNPEVHHLENGRMRVQLSIATHDYYKTKEGEKMIHTDWHEVIFWTPHAEIAAQYLSKGKQVYIEGKLSYRSYMDKEGQQRHTTQIIGKQLVLLNTSKTEQDRAPIQWVQSTPQRKTDDMGEIPI